jgi:hypothetical protein
MKRSIVIAAIAALALSLSAAAQAPPRQPRVDLCVAPYEWCQIGCEALGGYVGDTFHTLADAVAFETTVLTPLQRETVRLTTLQQIDRHVLLLYRAMASQVRAADPGSDTCPATTSRPRIRELSIDTATIELMRLPTELRETASIFMVPPVPNYPSTALLVWLPPSSFDGDTDGAAAVKR